MLTPLGPSARLALCSRCLFVTSPETRTEASLAAIDLRVVMMAERLPGRGVIWELLLD